MWRMNSQPRNKLHFNQFLNGCTKFIRQSPSLKWYNQIHPYCRIDHISRTGILDRCTNAHLSSFLNIIGWVSTCSTLFLTTLMAGAMLGKEWALNGRCSEWSHEKWCWNVIVHPTPPIGERFLWVGPSRGAVNFVFTFDVPWLLHCNHNSFRSWLAQGPLLKKSIKYRTVVFMRILKMERSLSIEMVP